MGHRRRGMFVAYALLSVSASHAIADDPAPSPAPQAPWLRPWLPPGPADVDPVLAEGTESSIAVSTGPMMSKFAPLAVALSETGEYGRFLASSTKQALSVEGVEKLSVVLDHSTPSFGFLGAGVRRIGRRSGRGFGSIDFERISTGMALMSRGSDLDGGIGAEIALGFLTANGSGLGVNADAYFFNVSHFTGPDRLFVVSLGYVYSPFTGSRPGTPLGPTPSTRPEPSGQPCRDLEAYRAALIEHRKRAVDACNAGRAEECNSEHDVVVALDHKMERCEQGEDVGPP